MENNDALLEGLDFNLATNKFVSEDDARTYDFRVETMLEQERVKNPSYKTKKILAEFLVGLSEFNIETNLANEVR
ncbi:MAG: hypothetical protein WCQ32_01725 [bacterium]